MWEKRENAFGAVLLTECFRQWFMFDVRAGPEYTAMHGNVRLLGCAGRVFAE